MHVVMFGDQHAETLGGAQVSVRLQRRFLEKAGHTVTIVAPAMHGARTRAVPSDSAYVDLPSIPITLDREYSMSWPGRRTDLRVDAALEARPPVDVVHIQADFWGALIGYRFARRHDLPVVHTMHNRLDVGIEATAPFPNLVLRVLNAWQRRSLGVTRDATSGRDGWSYLRRFAGLADAVTAPSEHFARRLEEHDVVPRGHRALLAGSDGSTPEPRVDVIWNGIDDDLLDETLALPPASSENLPRHATRGAEASAPGASRSQSRPPEQGRRPRFVWLGRMSPEKRLMPFLEAVAASGIDADVEVIGGGGQLRAARRLVEKRQAKAGLSRAEAPLDAVRARGTAGGGTVATVVFAGRMPYAQTLRRIAAADAVVQTSIGFETQGMTIFEAASLGTPAIISDPDLAAELGSGFWPVGEPAAFARGVPDPSVAALATALRAAASEIASETPRVPDPSIRERFRQSSRTAAMIEVYERVSS